MPGMLPIVVAGAALLLLSKKKSTATGEPDYAPGGGFEDEDEAIDLILQGKVVPPRLSPVVANLAGSPASPANTMTTISATVVKKEEEDVKPANGCKVGTISADKKYVCWGSPGAVDKNMKVMMRRVVPYKEARNIAAAVAIGTIGGGGVALTQSPRVQFALYCWFRRKDLYRCTSRYKTGRKRCKPGQWARY